MRAVFGESNLYLTLSIAPMYSPTESSLKTLKKEISAHFAHWTVTRRYFSTRKYHADRGL